MFTVLKRRIYGDMLNWGKRLCGQTLLLVSVACWKSVRTICCSGTHPGSNLDIRKIIHCAGKSKRLCCGSFGGYIAKGVSAGSISVVILCMINQIAVLADIALPAVACTDGQMFCAVSDQIFQSFSASGIPLGVMVWDRQYHEGGLTMESCAVAGPKPTRFKFGYKEDNSLCRKIKKAEILRAAGKFDPVYAPAPRTPHLQLQDTVYDQPDSGFG